MPPELVTLVLDGRTTQVPKGTLLIEAAAAMGTYVPRFCSHEHLVPYAGCRMCLVAIDGMPKLATACSTPVMPGRDGAPMVVHTDTPQVREARQGVLEFILLSHPLDCPVCDKGGECELQDQTFIFGPPDSRMIDPKRFKMNADLSATIKLDYNRCILCRRCVRFTEEIGDDDRLIFRDRGAVTEIDTQTGEPFNSRYGGTVIEYCPVGALTDQVFRFRARPWEIKPVASTCTGCAMGCAEELHIRSGHLVRVFNRAKADVNGFYICDKGRFNHEWMIHPERITEPMVRRNGRLVATSWEEAIAQAASDLKAVAADDASAIAVLAGGHQALEGLGALKLLAEGLGTPHQDQVPSVMASPAQATFLVNRLALYTEAVYSENLVLIDSHLFDELPMLALRIKQSRQGLVEAWGPQLKAQVVSLASTRTAQSRYDWTNETVIPRHEHPAFLLALAKQLLGRANAPELHQALKEAALKLGGSEFANAELVAQVAERLGGNDAVLGIGHQVLLQDPERLTLIELVVRCREAARGRLLKLLPALPAANSAGALALGLLPRWDKRGPVGKNAEGIASAIGEGKLRALILADADVSRTWPHATIEHLSNLRGFIAITPFLDEVTSQATVVFPALTSAEASGITVNSEGRLQAVPAGAKPPTSECRPLGRLIAEIAARLELDIAPERMALLSQIAHTAPALREAPQVSPTVDAFIEPAPFESKTIDLRALNPQPLPPREGNVTLMVRRPFWTGAQLLEHSPEVGLLQTPWHVLLNTDDAKAFGIRAGDTVRLSTAAGAISAPSMLSRGIPRGYAEIEGDRHETFGVPLGLSAYGCWTVAVQKVAAVAPTREEVGAQA